MVEDRRETLEAELVEHRLGSAIVLSPIIVLYRGRIVRERGQPEPVPNPAD